MDIAVLVDCNGLATAYAYLCYGFLLEVDAQTAILKLYVDKRDVVLGEHRVLDAAYLDAKLAIVDSLHYGEVFLLTALLCVGHQLGHLLATAEGGYATVNCLYYYIATMVAFIKLHCHNCNIF